MPCLLSFRFVGFGFARRFHQPSGAGGRISTMACANVWRRRRERSNHHGSEAGARSIRERSHDVSVDLSRRQGERPKNDVSLPTRFDAWNEWPDLGVEAKQRQCESCASVGICETDELDLHRAVEWWDDVLHHALRSSRISGTTSILVQIFHDVVDDGDILCEYCSGVCHAPLDSIVDHERCQQDQT